MNKFNYAIEASIKIDITKGGYILTYPSISSFMASDTNGVSVQQNMVIEVREVFTSVPKMKKKIAEVIDTFTPIIEEQ